MSEKDPHPALLTREERDEIYFAVRHATATDREERLLGCYEPLGRRVIRHHAAVIDREERLVLAQARKLLDYLALQSSEHRLVKTLAELRAAVGLDGGEE